MSEPGRLRKRIRHLLQQKDVSAMQVLTAHFLRQVFQTGDTAATETPIVRALAAVATPMLMAAFWIVLLARGLKAESAADIHYVFVLYSFCAMGCVTTLQWDRFFPERIDFLILLPMPLRGRTILWAKLRAVGLFLALFLFSANIFGTVLIPVLAGWKLPLAMLAHGWAVLSAGTASALAVLALESLVIAVAPDRWFRSIATITQTGLITAFLTLFLRMDTVMNARPQLFSGSVPGARWFPPLWFLSAYEVGMASTTVTGFARTLARHGVLCLPILFVLVATLYPLAWKRRHRVALEGTRSAHLQDSGLWGILYGNVLWSPDARVIFHFIRQTLTRLAQYHVALAAYVGAGLALSITVAIHIETDGRREHIALITTGLQAVMPLLLFWTVAGLRAAFTVPADINARWIFRLAGLSTRLVISIVKFFVFSACAIVILGIMLVLCGFGWRGSDLLLQGIFGLCCSVLLIDSFFFFEAHIPFTRPPLPGRSSLPMTLALYLFGVPVLVLLMVTLERWAGSQAWRVVEICCTATAIHLLLHWLRGLPSHPVPEDAFMDELAEEIQTLGLSR